MRTWQRVSVPSVQCGGCPATILKGELVQLISLPGVKTPRVRCQACAGGEPPKTLPAVELTFTNERGEEQPVKAMTRLGSLKTRFDWKQRSAGE